MPGLVSPQQQNNQGNSGTPNNSGQGPGNPQTQNNANSRSSPGPSDESMKKALAALGLPQQPSPGKC